jgi:cell division protein ZipA
MEADILRLILFLVGAAVIFGIYAADRYKRGVQEQPYEDDIDQDEASGPSGHIEPRWDKLYEPEESTVAEDPIADDQAAEDQFEDTQPLDEPAYESDESEIQDSYAQDTYAEEEESEEPAPSDIDDAISSELEHLEEIIHDDPRFDPNYDPEYDDSDKEMPKEQMSISFLSRETPKESPQPIDPDLPTKIIQLNVVPHEELFYGDDIQSVAYEVGLEPGDMNVFHHFGDDPEKQQPVYSMASMVEPGTFPMDDMDSFSTPGVTLFAQLPGPKDGLTIFADMLYAAEQLANLLNGELRDNTHSALTKQTIGHMREDIQEYHRQLQLARSKR